MNKNEKMLPIIAGISSSIIFGFSFLFIKGALEMIDPIDLLALRFGIATLLLLILKAVGIIKINFEGKNLKPLLILSIFQPVLYFIFETLGVRSATTSEAGMMMAIIPIMVTCLAAIYLKEIPSKKQVLFIGVSLIGVISIVLASRSGNDKGTIWGIFFLFMAVICAAMLNILSRKSSVVFKPVETTFFMMCTGAVFFNVVSMGKHFITGTDIVYISLLGNESVLIAVLYLGILSSVIGFFLVNYALANMEASRAAIFGNLITVTSIAAGVLILKESFTIYQFMGCLMILLGVWGTNYYGEKKKLIQENNMRME
ncbi:EamA family transporter [Lutibacter sp. B2]|nr:EamA family transporter [Lutibacter sp. B2]